MPDKVRSNVANACCKRVCVCVCSVCVCVHSPNMLSLKLFTDSSVCPSCLPNCPSNRSVCILILTAHRLRQSPTVRCPYAPPRAPYCLSITLGFSRSLSVSLSVPLSVWLPRFVCQSVSPTDTLNIIMQPRLDVVPRRCCCPESAITFRPELPAQFSSDNS